MWGGRFEERLDPEILEFTSSFSIDRRLLQWDITASIAHAIMLGETGVISTQDTRVLADGLRGILTDVRAGRLVVEGPFEDVHSFIEATLYARTGPTAGRLHTARSRNDQVVTAFRLYLKEHVTILVGLLCELMATLLARAEATQDVLMPGFTHLQHAQPVRLAHHLLAYFWMLERDADRFIACYRRADVLPLGSGALAGVSFPVNRGRVADLLGFARISENSIDATGDRDFAVDAVSAAALLMVHLSRWGEEVVLWSSEEFGFVTLADSVATGSSLMPQKKNPDPVELIRGRAGRVIGSLTALLAMLKGLPIGYQRDLQEDKATLFEALEITTAAVRAMGSVLQNMQFHSERMEEATRRGLLTATEIADYLARKGLPFREAHAVAGRVVQVALARGRQLWELSLHDFEAASPLFEQDVLDAVTVGAAVEAKRVPGGTARYAVTEQLGTARARLGLVRRWLEEAASAARRPRALLEGA